MELITIAILVFMIIFVGALLLTRNNSKTCQDTKKSREGDETVKESRKATIVRPRAQLDYSQWVNPEPFTQDEIVALRYLQSVHTKHFSQRSRVLPKGREPRYRDGKIILYHYTTYHNSLGIQRDRLIRSSDQNTKPQHKRYGEGVYFTSLSPYDLEPDQLALNCFTHRGTVVTSRGIYSRTRYVVEIEFYPYEVEKLHIFDRDVYIFRGSINLREYVRRYRIYKNPKHPYDPEYSFYANSIGF